MTGLPSSSIWHAAEFGDPPATDRKTGPRRLAQCGGILGIGGKEANDEATRDRRLAGRIGADVVAELAGAGTDDVVAFDRVRPAAPAAGVRYRSATRGPGPRWWSCGRGWDAIVHLSAIPSPRTYPNATVFRTNVMGTFNVHEAAVLAGVPLVVSTSSQSAYGFAWQHRPSDRSTSPSTRPTPTSPRTPTACPR